MGGSYTPIAPVGAGAAWQSPTGTGSNGTKNNVPGSAVPQSSQAPTGTGSNATKGGTASPTTKPVTGASSGGATAGNVNYANGGQYPGSVSYTSSSGAMSYPADTVFHGNHNITDPYQANQNMASQIASFGAQSIPGAAAFQQGLFEPGFNAMENAYLNSEGERQTRLLNGQMAQLGNKFGGTPFHSGYLNSARELGAQAASNLGQTAQGLAINRQNNAAQALTRILGNPLDATQRSQDVTSSMLGMIQTLQQAPVQQGLSYLNNSPIMAPTIIPGAQTISQ